MTYKQLVTKNGLAHGCINTVANSVEDNDFKYAKPDAKEKLKAQKKDESRIVSARYLHKDGGNERCEKPYMRWAGEPITMWRLLHDHVYELPYGFIKEINEEQIPLPQRSEILDANGVPSKVEGRAQKTHQLVPVGF